MGILLSTFSIDLICTFFLAFFVLFLFFEMCAQIVLLRCFQIKPLEKLWKSLYNYCWVLKVAVVSYIIRCV